MPWHYLEPKPVRRARHTTGRTRACHDAALVGCLPRHSPNGRAPQLGTGNSRMSSPYRCRRRLAGPKVALSDIANSQGTPRCSPYRTPSTPISTSEITPRKPTASFCATVDGNRVSEAARSVNGSAAQLPPETAARNRMEIHDRRPVNSAISTSDARPPHASRRPTPRAAHRPAKLQTSAGRTRSL